MTDKLVALVTCGNREEAGRIAQALVEGRWAACVNIVESPVRSIYRWQGKVETADEHLLVIKTSRRKFAALEEAVRRQHSYAVPEVIALPIRAGSANYLAWLAESLGELAKPARRRRGVRGKRRKAR
jgi:periplasmic divalent cation tolerance protein